MTRMAARLVCAAIAAVALLVVVPAGPAEAMCEGHISPVRPDGTYGGTSFGGSFLTPLAIGQTVAVWRAGDVIPRVTAPIGEQPHDLTPWAPPEACPQCGGEWDKTSLLWRCHTPSCALAKPVGNARAPQHSRRARRRAS